MWAKIEKNFEEAIMGVFLIGMACIMMLQIIMRSFGSSITWAEEIARYMYVWSVFLSIACTIRQRNILRVDLVLQAFPAGFRRVLDMLLDLVNVILYGYLAWSAITVVKNVKTAAQTSPALVLPMWIVYAIIPVGFGLACLRSVQKIYFDLRGINDTVPANPSDSAS